MMKSSRSLWFVAGLAITAGLAYLFREPALQSVGDILITQDPLEPADVIHVVSGPDHRTAYAIALYKQGYAKHLFFTGGWCAEIQGVHADRSRQQSLEQGIPASVIDADPFQVTSTYQEAERLKLWIDQLQQPVRSVMIVSDPHHMKRARWTYQQVLGEGVRLIMAPVPFEQTPDQRRWWADAGSRSMVRDEYVKFAYYFARYKLSWGPLKDWLASLDRD